MSATKFSQRAMRAEASSAYKLESLLRVLDKAGVRVEFSETPYFFVTTVEPTKLEKTVISVKKGKWVKGC